MARYGTKGTMRKFFQPSVSQLETHLLGINCMINKSLLAIAGIRDYIELPTCKIMILTILRCSYCFLSCLRSFDSLKSGISFQLKHKRIRVLHLLKWSTWKCKSLKTPRLVITGKETNPWEYVTELPLMVAAFYPIFFFFSKCCMFPTIFKVQCQLGAFSTLPYQIYGVDQVVGPNYCKSSQQFQLATRFFLSLQNFSVTPL